MGRRRARGAKGGPGQGRDDDSGLSTPSEDEGVAADGAEEAAVTRCPHAGKAVHVAAIKKALKTAWTKVGQCSPCAKQARQANQASQQWTNGKKKAEAPEAPGKCRDPSKPVHVWMCLRCGLQLCDSNSTADHFAKHCAVPRSDKHCIGLDLMTWRLRCIECDAEVPVDSYKKVREAVDFVRKIEETKGRSATAAGPVVSSKDAGAAKRLTGKGDGGGGSAGLTRPRGLSNLGNTCFFNAVMQSLSQTHPLLRIADEQSRKGTPFLVPEVVVPPAPLPDLKEEEKTREARLLAKEGCTIEAMSLTLSEAGSITQALSAFLKDMSTKGKQGVLNPGFLFGKVCNKAPQFRGFHQQDAHELLRQLMEGLRSEDIKRQRTAILKHFSLNEKTDPKSVPWPTRRRVQALSRHSTYTFVDRMFGGHLVSTIVCEQCHNSSQIYEPFLDLSLPVVEEKPQRPNVKKAKSVTSQEADNEPVSMGKTERAKSKKEKRRLKKLNKKGRKGRVDSDDRENEISGGEQEKVEPEKLAVDDKLQSDCKDEEDMDGEELKLRKEMEENEKDGSASPENGPSDDKSQTPENDHDRDAVEEKLENSRDSGLAMSKQSVSEGHKEQDQVQKAPAPNTVSDGNEEDDEDDGYSEDDEGWEWDYGEGEQEKSQKDVTKEEDSDNKSTYLPVEAEGKESPGELKEPLKSLNPLPPERLARGSSEREKSSDPTGENDDDGSISSGSGTSMVGDVEDNLDDTVKVERPSPFRLNQQAEDPLLQRLLSFRPDPDHLDPHMEELCRKVRRLSVASVQVQNLSEAGSNNFHADDNDRAPRNGDDDGTSVSSASAEFSTEQQQSLRNEWVARSLTSIAPRYHAKAGECSVYSCLTQFTAPELLTGNNKWACDKCTRIQAAKKAKRGVDEVDSSDVVENGDESSDASTKGDDDSADGSVKKKPKQSKCPTVYSNASKQLLIFSPPAVLTIHLKRFQQTMFNLRKVNRHVDFPLTLDLAPFCSTTSVSVPSVSAGAKAIRYSLYAVVEHQGRLHGGHYTAYVKVREAALPPGADEAGAPANDYQRFYSQPSGNEDFQALLREIERKYRAHVEAQDLKDHMEEDQESAKETALNEPRFSGNQKWFHISDTHVSEVSEDKVLKCQAYILFYERVE